MSKLFFLPLIVLLLCKGVIAQTQPMPFDLSQNNFSFDAWDSLAASQTYPQSMYFHRVGSQNPTDNDTATGDWDCAYNLGAGSRFLGKGAEGISFRNIGAAQTDNCLTGGPTNAGGYVGIAVAAINTTLRQNIQVSWIGRMLSNLTFSAPQPGSPGNPVNRFYGIKCQYRIGQSGFFTDLSSDSLFLCNVNDSTYHSEFFSDTLGPVLLPTSCENQPLVQIRWIYFQTNTGSGPRPELGVDNISITSDVTTIIEHRGLNTKTKKLIKHNPVYDKVLKLNETGRYSIINVLGQLELNFSGSESELGSLSPGIYFLKDSNGLTERFILN